jgi:hypothetical protein
MKSIFIVGTGKCGESFLNKLFKNNLKIECYDESRPFLQSYYKFIKYNKLNIDDSPFFLTIDKAIKNCNKKKKIYLESSSHLAFHVNELIKRFDAKIIILIRNPNYVCQDLIEKGWYKKKYSKTGTNTILGYQGLASNPHNKHHNFSRISPNGKYFYKWNTLHPLLKAKWYWNEVNSELVRNIKNVSKKNYKIFKIENFSYNNYLEICEWLKIIPNINSFKFSILTNIEKLKNRTIHNKKLILLKKFRSKIEDKFYKENIC